MATEGYAADMPLQDHRRRVLGVCGFEAFRTRSRSIVLEEVLVDCQSSAGLNTTPSSRGEYLVQHKGLRGFKRVSTVTTKRIAPGFSFTRSMYLRTGGYSVSSFGTGEYAQWSRAKKQFAVESIKWLRLGNKLRG